MNYEREEVENLRPEKSMADIEVGRNSREPKFTRYLNELHAIACQLEQKLDGVLLPEYPTKDGAAIEEAASPLEHNLRDLVNLYSRLARRISL